MYVLNKKNNTLAKFWFFVTQEKNEKRQLLVFEYSRNYWTNFCWFQRFIRWLPCFTHFPFLSVIFCSHNCVEFKMFLLYVKRIHINLQDLWNTFLVLYISFTFSHLFVFVIFRRGRTHINCACDQITCCYMRASLVDRILYSMYFRYSYFISLFIRLLIVIIKCCVWFSTPAIH